MRKTDTTNCKKKYLIIIIFCIILIIILVLGRLAYSKYMHTQSTTVSIKTATIVCEMEVVSSEDSNAIINPYCTVNVKDYIGEKVTETDINFKIEVSPKGDFILPEYYWKDSSGTILARSTPVTGTFTNGVKEDKEYTIVFLNSGEVDISRSIDFNLVAVQAQE